MPAANLARNAAPARFDPAAAERRALIAKIHVAKKEMGLVDDDYRVMLFRVAGETSAKDCDVPRLRTIVEEMKRLGFQARPRGGAARARPADHPGARKARALWISLHQLGAIDNPSEQALEAFAARQLKVDRMQWADQALMYKLIEALKAIAERSGWSQDTTGCRTPAGKLRVLKIALCDALLAKLKGSVLADASWSLDVAALRLLGHIGEDGMAAGHSSWPLSDFDIVAQGFAAKLRAGR